MDERVGKRKRDREESVKGERGRRRQAELKFEFYIKPVDSVELERPMTNLEI